MHIITVSSFKGGTAKTSIALHLAAVLVEHHHAKVLLIDFDSQANLTAGLGFDPDHFDSIASVLQGTKEVKDVVLETYLPDLHLIPADTWLERVEVTGTLASDRYSHEKLKTIISPLNYDYIIIDTPPSLCWLTESALIASHYSLICSTPEFYSVKGLERLALFIESISKRHPINVIGVALSFWNSRGKSNQAFLEIIERTFPDKLLNTKIRRDITVSEATIFGKSVFTTSPNSRAAEDYLSLTNEILERLHSTVSSYGKN